MLERISKLQKFILEAAYKKTVLRQPLPDRIWKWRSIGRKEDELKVNGSRDELREQLYFQALYESDILLGFYHLENNNGENYGYKGGSNKEKTALRRSLKTLYERGYIEDYEGRCVGVGRLQRVYGHSVHEESFYSPAIVMLTEKGREKAREFLKVV